MSVLQGFPMLSQLTDTQEANREFDCVPTCIAASLTYLLGRPFDAAAIKDEVYGKGYTGGTNAANYVSYCAKQGVKLEPVQGIPGALVTKAHALIQQGIPAILTEPDPYADPKLGWSHVCVFYAEGPGYLVAMDPYPLPGITTGHPVRHTDQEWTELLLFNQLWTLEKIGGEDLAININTPGVANEYQELDASHWKSKKTGKFYAYGILAEFQRIGYQAGWGHPLSNEVYYNAQESKQNCECVVVGYSKATGKVTLLPLYDGGAGTDPALADLEKQLAAAKAATQNSTSLTVVKQIKSLVAPF